VVGLQTRVGLKSSEKSSHAESGYAGPIAHGMQNDFEHPMTSAFRAQAEKVDRRCAGCRHRAHLCECDGWLLCAPLEWVAAI